MVACFDELKLLRLAEGLKSRLKRRSGTEFIDRTVHEILRNGAMRQIIPTPQPRREAYRDQALRRLT